MKVVSASGWMALSSEMILSAASWLLEKQSCQTLKSTRTVFARELEDRCNGLFTFLQNRREA